jgi:hypothetical protein
MLTSLLREVRIWLAIWRRRLAWYRLVGTTGDLPFVAMLGLPILGVAGIVCFAYLHGTRIEPARIEAMQREAKRALRRESDLQCLAERTSISRRAASRSTASTLLPKLL